MREGEDEIGADASLEVKLKFLLTKWLADNTTSSGVPFILLWDLGDMRFDRVMEHIVTSSMALLENLGTTQEGAKDSVTLVEEDPRESIDFSMEASQNALLLYGLVDVHPSLRILGALHRTTGVDPNRIAIL